MENKAPRMGASLAELNRRRKSGTLGEIAADWKWILRYSARHKGAIALYLLLGMLSTTLSLAGSVVSKYLIDIVTGHRFEHLPLLLGLMVGSTLSGLVFTALTNRITMRLSIRIHNDIQADVFTRILDADWLALSSYAHGDLLNRIHNDVRTVSSNAIHWLPDLLLAGYRFLATFFVILHFDAVMAVIALASAPVLLLCSRFLLSRQRRHAMAVRDMSSKVMGFEAEAFGNMDTIKSFGVESYYGTRLRGWQNRMQQTLLDQNRFQIQSNILLSLLSQAVQLAAFGYCLFLLWTNAITFGTMTMFLQQRSALTAAMSELAAMVPNFLNSAVAAHRIRELTELPRDVHLSGTAPQTAGGLTVELRNVDFAYKDTPVLQRSALTAAPGEIVALVGASGEGKTTLVRLMLGLVRPQSGDAVLRTADGAEIPLNADTRHLFSYVPQGNTMISGTIADNLRLVRPDATPAEMESALRSACAWEFVSALPDGMDSEVGERGRGLSEGQAQRIAIARAILRDAPVVLLDEATSALDVATERRVLKNIVAACPDKTCIVTTHRPSVLSLCRRVYRVMDTQVTLLTEEESARMVMEF